MLVQGDIVGLWTVLDVSEELVTQTKYPRRAVLVECICSKQKLLRYNDFIEGRSTACRSCLNSEKATFESAMTEVFLKYKRSAKKRGFVFRLKLENFITLVNSDCFYCGKPPGNKIRRVKAFSYNGVDRKNNRTGYTDKNCVPCCGICNRGKNNMGYKEWVKYLDDMVDYRNGITTV